MRRVARAAMQHRLGAGRGAVVHGGVGHVHAGQLADQGLELEDRLQGPLADFRLVGGVGGVEFAAGDQLVDHRRDEVVVGAAAEERGVGCRGGIAAGEPAQLPQQVALGQGRAGRCSGRVEADRGGDFAEELLHRGDPDRRQHLADILLGMGNVTHGIDLHAENVKATQVTCHQPLASDLDPLPFLLRKA